MTDANEQARLAVDVGGTFTDVVLEQGRQQYTLKVLTTPLTPEEGVLTGVEAVLSEARIRPQDLDIIIHGTTLATNALIERKGAKTALVTTEGLRDSVEMALENRFEQYDINIDRPAPIVPRYLRWAVRERMNFEGKVLLPLDEKSVRAIVPLAHAHKIEAIAVGLIHSYANEDHERKVGKILRDELPGLSITLSSEVCPEIREYERQSTASANAYVQPKMSRYLTELDKSLKALGVSCPFFLMTSGGGLMTLETAIRFPIRLVESGPAGGAILASYIARECNVKNVVSYDMGGTTAKLCLIDDYEPQSTRAFEVARVYRNLRGSGLPVRIPAIEMVEIGAGGGSIAHIDTMGRINVGPKSAGAEPGPACYDQGGDSPTVTDADVILGRIDPDRFAGGRVKMVPKRAYETVHKKIGQKTNMTDIFSAFGISEIVDENMASAARVHAIEWGKDISARAMIAFGGAAPLHASRLAEKLGIDKVIVPAGAGVGSAIGFLRAPIAYEVVRSRYLQLKTFDHDFVNELIEDMRVEARAVVELGAAGTPLDEARFAYMRYVGQGHEIIVPLPLRPLKLEDVSTLRQAFEAEYTRLYGRLIPGQEVEILSWTLTISANSGGQGSSIVSQKEIDDIATIGNRDLFDADTNDFVDAPVYLREDLSPGAIVRGPALISEDQTTTVVTSNFTASVDSRGYLILDRHLERKNDD